MITVQKPAIERQAYFFLQDQLGQYFQGPTIFPALFVADLGVQARFIARGLAVAQWDINMQPASSGEPVQIDPTPYVQDFVPLREVPVDLAPWILLTPPATFSPAFLLWRAVACRRLLASLVSSIWVEDGVVWFQASGPPLYRLRADDPSVSAAFDPLTRATIWVFLSGLDIEARHIIFASELARSNRADQVLTDMLEEALDSAKATYEAHVQSASRETLKALAELRQGVIDETQKVVQKTKDMTEALWRDLAVTAAPFVLEILGDVGKITNKTTAAGFYFAAAMFIALSFSLQWRINHAYFKSQTKARDTWLRALYSYVSARERNEIAVTPITDAMCSYRETRAVLLVVYVILVSILVVFGVYTWLQAASAPALLAYWNGIYRPPL